MSAERRELFSIVQPMTFIIDWLKFYMLRGIYFFFNTSFIFSII